MKQYSGLRAALLILLTILPALAQQASAQQPKFEIADVHVSPTARGFAQNFGGVLRGGRYVNRDATMLNLIVDATGLPGGWDFLIGWTPRGALQTPQSPNPDQPGGVVETAAPSGISVFDAIEKELGLKLVKQKRSIQVIVVDHVDEKPIE